MQGGRWNLPGSFAVIYAAPDLETVDAEFDRAVRRARLSREQLRPRQLATLRLDLRNVLDLRDEAVLQILGLAREELVQDDVTLPQLLGDVAHDVGYEAVLAPSAASSGDVIAIFPDNRLPESSLEVVGVRAYPGRTKD